MSGLGNRPGEFSEATIAKATKLVARGDVSVDIDHPESIFWVTGSGGNRYRVQTDWDSEKNTLSWITCTCPHGLNTGAGSSKCYHAAAVLITLRESHTKNVRATRPATREEEA